jgi:hypothetical protein
MYDMVKHENEKIEKAFRSGSGLFVRVYSSYLWRIGNYFINSRISLTSCSASKCSSRGASRDYDSLARRTIPFTTTIYHSRITLKSYKTYHIAHKIARA